METSKKELLETLRRAFKAIQDTTNQHGPYRVKSSEIARMALEIEIEASDSIGMDPSTLDDLLGFEA